MKLADAVSAAYNKRWSVSNNFTVQFILKGKQISTIGQFPDEINLNIINIKTPDISNSGIEAFIANKWHVHNGRDNLYKFSITFRDENQMALYKKFQDMYHLSRDYYFDEVAFDVILYKDADWHGEEQREIIRLEDTMVDAVSNLDFNNTSEAAIAEFTVEFKCVNPYF